MKEIDRLRNILDELRSDGKERENLLGIIERLRNELTDLEEQKKGKLRRAHKLIADFTVFNNQLEEAKREIRDVENLSRRTEEKLNEIKQIEDGLLENIEKIKSLVDDGKTQIDKVGQGLEKEQEALKNQLKTKQEELSKVSAAFNQSEKEKETLRAAEAKLRKEVVELQSQLIENETEGSTLSTIIERTNEEIRNARERLERAGSQYKLGTINMELMVIPAGQGNKFILPEKVDEIVQGGQLSKLELEFTPRDSSDKTSDTILVPNLVGLTEVMAERSLANVGFAIDVKFEAIPLTASDTTGRNKVGRVVRQIPTPGASKPYGEAVIVFIGKASEILTIPQNPE